MSRPGCYSGFMIRALLFSLIAACASNSACWAQAKSSYQYFRAGNSAGATVSPHPGFALMGGGTDLDEAFRWLCDHAAGGDLLVLRATGKDDYNPYIQKLCRLNSVATLVIPDRSAAQVPFVANAIRHAGVLFIAGGDQANYVNYWSGTPVQDELNAAIERGIPIGGTSAGLAVLGEYAYSARGDKPDDPNLDGKTAMADPFGPRITLEHGFLHVPLLTGIITDSHFARRNRMGRLLVFLGRLNQPANTAAPAGAGVRGLGIDERAAVLLDPDGTARVVGQGPAYLVECPQGQGTVLPQRSFTFGPYSVHKFGPGESFNVKAISGGVSYSLSVSSGVIRSTQAGGSVY